MAYEQTVAALLHRLAALVLAVGALAFAWFPPAPTLADDAAFLGALRTQNVRYLQSSVLWPKQPPTPILQTPSIKDTGPRATQIGKGPLLANISLHTGKPRHGEAPRFPVLSLSLAGRTIATVAGAGAGFFEPPYLVQIVEMDPSNPHPEVVFSTFTGGAHCCSDTRVVTSDPDGARWRTVKAGEFDGDIVRAQDLDGDGRFELAHGDDRFLYAFSCYACSVPPLQVLRLAGPGMVDVSDEMRYRPAHEAWLKAMIGSAQPGLDRNGFLAGYVAQKIRLGEGDAAWSLMLKHYDRASNWGLEECPQGYDAKGTCEGSATVRTFPDALRRFLNENGYVVP